MPATRTMVTRELDGVALDWAVASATGLITKGEVTLNKGGLNCWDEDGADSWTPSKWWGQGGPLIEKERIAVAWNGSVWVAHWTSAEGDLRIRTEGKSLLIAGLRCIARAHLGAEVDVPTMLFMQN